MLKQWRKEVNLAEMSHPLTPSTNQPHRFLFLPLLSPIIPSPKYLTLSANRIPSPPPPLTSCHLFLSIMPLNHSLLLPFPQRSSSFLPPLPSSFSMVNMFNLGPNISQHKLVPSRPNLSSLAITNYLHSNYQPLVSTCNLSCLDKGTIHAITNISHSVFVGWLQVFTNVKKLTLSYHTLKLILKVSYFWLFSPLFIFTMLL